MSFQKAILFSLTLSLSTLPSFGQLLGGVEFGDNRNEVEKKLKASPLVDAKSQSSMFARTGLNGAFKTTRTLDGLQYAIYYDWKDGDTLKSLNLHSTHIPTTEYPSKLKASWSYLINFLSSRHGQASNAGTYPNKNLVAMDNMYFTHEWKTDTGYLYMGPGLEKNGYKLVMTFTKYPLTAADPQKARNKNNGNK